MDTRALERARKASTGHLLFEVARRLDERALERVNAAPGRPPGVAVRPAHSRLFLHITTEGIRITDLAAKLGVTKQAVQPLVAELAEWGAVEIVADPLDGRAKLVRWTEFGLQANLHGLSVLREIEDELAERIGKKRMRELRAILAEILEEL